MQKILKSAVNFFQSDNESTVDAQTISKIDAARFLQQAQFSSTASEIAELQQLGYDDWLTHQINMPVAETAVYWLYKHKFALKEYGQNKLSRKLLDQVIWQQLCTSPDTLRKRVALALSEIFVVSNQGIGLRYSSMAIAHYWDILNRHAFGNYREMIEDITLSTAMGAYLNTMGNRKANPKKGSEADENYARELLQLFSIGLFELDIDGTVKTDKKGQPIETYSQEQISELAKVFTGYMVSGLIKKHEVTPNLHLKPMENNPKTFDRTKKKVFNVMIPAETNAQKTLSLALDAIANHDNVAPFISKQLIQRLVTSNPSKAYVKRVATVFNNNGKGQRGDLSAVIQAILLDKEARYPSNSQYVGKVREPMISLIQWVRTFSTGVSKSGRWNIVHMQDEKFRLGQNPFSSSSVFNFFRPNYSPSGKNFENTNIVAPEMYLVNETSIAGYTNFMHRVIKKGLPSRNGKKIEVKPDYSRIITLADSPSELVNHLNIILCAGTMNPVTQQYIIDAMALVKAKKSKRRKKVELALWMTMISPDYRVQR